MVREGDAVACHAGHGADTPRENRTDQQNREDALHRSLLSQWIALQERPFPPTVIDKDAVRLFIFMLPHCSRAARERQRRPRSLPRASDNRGLVPPRHRNTDPFLLEHLPDVLEPL